MTSIAGDGSAGVTEQHHHHEGRKVEAKSHRQKRKENASTGASAAAFRALSARLLTFYFRAPVKAFFRPRIDYMGYARAINPSVQAGQAWSWRMTTPALLASAIHHHGWSFIPNQFLPPLLANTAIGAVLYTAYLHTLATLHEPSSRAVKRVYPPPPPTTAFAAGFVAGSVQSVIAAPLDALQNRFSSAAMLSGKYPNMWAYAWHKWREIGARGIFAGFSLSFLRDSFGAGVFFASFELVKSQAFYSFVSYWYGSFHDLSAGQQHAITAQAQSHRDRAPEIRPHYMLEPTFLLLAGIAASLSQALVHYPLGIVQELYHARLEWIDKHGRLSQRPAARLRAATSVYAAAYRKTFRQCRALARRHGGPRAWLYRGFCLNTLRQLPSTSAGLIVFEILRRKYGSEDDAVRIPKDGYEIVLL